MTADRRCGPARDPVTVTFSLDQVLVGKVDAFAARLRVPREAALRIAVVRGLALAHGVELDVGVHAADPTVPARIHY